MNICADVLGRGRPCHIHPEEFRKLPASLVYLATNEAAGVLVSNMDFPLSPCDDRSRARGKTLTTDGPSPKPTSSLVASTCSTAKTWTKRLPGPPRFPARSTARLRYARSGRRSSR